MFLAHHTTSMTSHDPTVRGSSTEAHHWRTCQLTKLLHDLCKYCLFSSDEFDFLFFRPYGQAELLERR
jgi:hypothetical protein